MSNKVWRVVAFVTIVTVSLHHNDEVMGSRTMEDKNRVCEIRINEVYGDILEADENSYLELGGYCSKGRPAGYSLAAYKVLIIKEKNIVGMITPQPFRLNDEGLFTIAGSKLKEDEKSIDWTDNYVKHKRVLIRRKTQAATGTSTGIASFFTKVTPQTKESESAGAVPYIILLLKNPDLQKPWKISSITFEGKATHIPISSDMEAAIASSIDDAIIVGTPNSESEYELAERYVERFRGEKEYVLPYLLSLYLDLEPLTLSTESGAHESSSGGEGSSGNRNRRTVTKKPSPGPLDAMFKKMRTQQGQSQPASQQAPQQQGSDSTTGSGTSTMVSGPVPVTQAGSSTSCTSAQDPVPVQQSSSQRTSGRQSPSQPSSSQQSSSQPSSSAQQSQTASQQTEDTCEQTRKVKTQASLSRCTNINDGFFPVSFKITRPTPNQINRCDQEESVPVYALKYAALIAGSNPEDIEAEFPAGGVCSTCNQQLPPFPTKLNVGINTVFTYSKDHGLYDFPNMATLHQQGDTQNLVVDDVLKNYEKNLQIQDADTERAARERERLEQVKKDKEWNDMISNMNKFQKNRMPVKWIEEHKKEITWLELIPDTTQTDVKKQAENAKIRCKICSEYAEGGSTRLNMANINDLARKEGWLGSSSDVIRQKIKQHPQSEWHRDILAIKQEQQQRQIESGIATMQKKQFEKLSEEEKSTARMMLLVFAEQRLYIPFNAHPEMVKLLEMLGIDLGGEHKYHATHNSPPLLANTISQDLHKRLINYIHKTKMPFTLMLDSSVDTAGLDMVGIILQTIVKDAPAVFFYKMVPLGVDHTAQGYRALLEKAFGEDIIIPAKATPKVDQVTFLDVAKSQLVGMSSDSAAVFSGIRNGLGKILSLEWKGDREELWLSWCHAHRLALAARALVDKTDELETFETSINNIAKFYNNVNAKNLAHITEVALAWKHPPRRITYAFTLRWANAEDLVLARLRDMLPLLMIDLDAIAADDTNFVPDTRNRANALLNIVKSREFVLMVYIMSDIVAVLAKYSRLLQKSGSTVIGIHSLKTKLISELSALKNSKGTQMLILLNQLQCKKDQLSTTFNKCKSLNEVAASPGVRFKKTENYDALNLLDPRRTQGSSTQTYDKLIEQMIDTLVEDIEKYFPENGLEDLEILNPATFIDKAEEMKQGVYGLPNMTSIAERFKLNQATVLREWQDLTKGIATRSDYEVLVQNRKAPEVFWPFILSQNGVPIGPTMKNLIRKLLSLPNNSAPVERLYSIMNYLKTSRRSKMSPANLSNILRIIMNTNKDFQQFPYYKYGKLWQGRHVSKPGRKRPGPTPAQQPSATDDGPSTAKRILLDDDALAAEEEKLAWENKQRDSVEGNNDDDMILLAPEDMLEADPDQAISSFDAFLLPVE